MNVEYDVSFLVDIDSLLSPKLITPVAWTQNKVEQFDKKITSSNIYEEGIQNKYEYAKSV